MRKAKTTTVALSAVAALLATGGAAAAVATSSGDLSSTTSQTSAQADDSSADTSSADASSKHGPKKDGAKRLCKRAPKIDKKIDRVLRRLDAGAGKRGSTDRLEKRIDNARKAGHKEVADFLNERLKDRRALKPRLEDRQKDLTELRSWCADQRGKKSEGDSDKSGSSADS